MTTGCLESANPANGGLLHCVDPYDGLPLGVELAGELRNRHALIQQAQHLAFLPIGQR